ncbi:MAG: transcriptional regulator [Pseudomonadota bacterium]|nr:transcriptional regulator [Pseudomonadota bacterium]MDP2351688.1 transcriptional regulator [Pseudomonadota bacterium]
MERNTTRTEKALQGFDNLPDAAYVRLPVVSALRGCSNATTWRHVQQGLIPAPVKLSPGVTGWNVGELRRALAGGATQ